MSARFPLMALACLGLACKPAPRESEPTSQTMIAAQREQELKDLRQILQARLAEVNRELRARTSRPSLTPDLTELLRMAQAELQVLEKQFLDVERNAREADEAYRKAIEQVNRGEDLPTIRSEIDKDPDVRAAREKARALPPGTFLLPLAPLPEFPSEHPDEPRRRRERAQAAIDDAVAQVRARTTAMIIEGLRQQKDSTEAALAAVTERIANTKTEIANITERTHQLESLKAEERALRKSLSEITDVPSTTKRDANPLR